jgi:hypothetical protein
MPDTPRELTKARGGEVVELECPCCGDVAAEGEVTDGQALLCGCNGYVSVDAEEPAWVAISEVDECPPHALCRAAAQSVKGGG